MSKPINVRITDELEAKINKAVEEEKTTVTELTRKAIAEYVERRNMQTISFPIDDLNVKDLDMIYDSLTEIHQILLNNYNSCDYIDKLNRKDLGEKVDSSDIKKHKKDILRIASELMLEKVEELPIAVDADIHSFIDLLEQEPFDQNSLKRFGLKNEDVVEVLKQVFG